MNIHQVIDRALDDPIFAAELFAKAGKASKELGQQESRVPRGEAWGALMAEFAETPDELAQMTGVGESDEEFGTTTLTTSGTLTTTTTSTTLACTFTTTTTTTGTTTLTTTHVEK